MIIDLVFTFKKNNKLPHFLNKFWKHCYPRFVQMNDYRFGKLAIECYWPQVTKFTTEDAILHIVKSSNQRLDSGAWVAILAVPSLFEPRDLLTFLDCFSCNILHVYLLNDSNTGRYMAVLQLKDLEARSSMIRELNGVYYYFLTI
jgi:hypothetical protein